MSVHPRGSCRSAHYGLAFVGALVATAAALLPGIGIRAAIGADLVTMPVMLLAAGVFVAIAAEALATSGAAPTEHAPLGESPPWTGPELVTSLLLWATLVAAFASASHASPGVQSVAAAIGVAGVLLGAWLRVAAIRTLGHRFLSRPQPLHGATLEVRGVYSHLRHPSEAGVVLIACGAGLATLSPAALALNAALAALVCWRVNVEDRHLRAEFGLAHARYAARVPSLVPRRKYPKHATRV